ncbi:MAG: phosphatidate cytidylyltransferase, partial [Rhizobiaceae bacterium]|nr:phosphatidate cytidylyltransferase [Rhizobiaceae bacterium]
MKSPGPKSPGGRSNLQLRVISAVVLIAVALAATWAGGFWFRLLAVAIGGAMFWEWAAMAADRTSLRHRIGTGVLAAIPLGLVLYGASPEVVFGAIAAGAVLTAGVAIMLSQAGGLWVALVYATAPAAALAFLRGADKAGVVAILFLFAVVWATDIFAYFVGRAVGGRKLAPSISPGKTVSGAIGGAAAGLVAGAAVAAGFGSPWSLAAMALLALALSIVSQAGDLFESSVKR